MFIDEIKIEVSAGRGGNGMCSYRREKYVEFGGPWGGSGGKGGDVVFLGDSGMTTLYPFRFMKHVKAKNGEDGKSKGMTGAKADDQIIKVPLGTIVRHEDGTLIGEITAHEELLVIAKGGKGGRGNIALSSHRNPTPNFAERGDLGEHFIIHLELQVLADVGFIGFPSVGKSSLVKTISNAKTKVAAYPFTTLTPVLGMVEYDDLSFAVADLPGLIENAHEGSGLGDQFLKHLSRCRVFVHVIDPDRESILEDYNAIRHELKAYDETLLNREERIVINKSDLLDDADKENIKALFDAPVLFTSTFTSEGIQSLKMMLVEAISSIPTIEKIYDAPDVIRLPDEMPLTVSIIGDQQFTVEGDVLKKVYMRTDFASEEGIKRFARQLKALGVDDALRQKGAKHGATVTIYGYVFDYIDD